MAEDNREVKIGDINARGSSNTGSAVGVKWNVPGNNGWTWYTGLGHCCVCAGVCAHATPASFCWRHVGSLYGRVPFVPVMPEKTPEQKEKDFQESMKEAEELLKKKCDEALAKELKDIRQKLAYFSKFDPEANMTEKEEETMKRVKAKVEFEFNPEVNDLDVEQLEIGIADAIAVLLTGFDSTTYPSVTVKIKDVKYVKEG